MLGESSMKPESRSWPHTRSLGAFNQLVICRQRRLQRAWKDLSRPRPHPLPVTRFAPLTCCVVKKPTGVSTRGFKRLRCVPDAEAGEPSRAMSDWTYEMLRYAFSWNDECLDRFSFFFAVRWFLAWFRGEKPSSTKVDWTMIKPFEWQRRFCFEQRNRALCHNFKAIQRLSSKQSSLPLTLQSNLECLGWKNLCFLAKRRSSEKALKYVVTGRSPSESMSEFQMLDILLLTIFTEKDEVGLFQGVQGVI